MKKTCLLSVLLIMTAVAAAEANSDPWVSTGYVNTCAISPVTHALFCWGNNTSGQIGDGTTTNRLVPTAVRGFTATDHVISVAVAKDDEYVCAIKGVSNGSAFVPRLFCWGANGSGQLGDGTLTNRSTPTAVVGLNDNASGVIDVSPGGTHTCALIHPISGGSAKCWGGNSYGELGQGFTSAYVLAPTTPINWSTGVSMISTANASTCGIRNGNLYCFGYNANGQLGTGDTTNRSQEGATSFGGGAVTYVDIGRLNGCILAPGQVDTIAYCWGDNTYGQIGSGYAGGSYLSPAGVTGTAAGTLPGGPDPQVMQKPQIKVGGYHLIVSATVTTALCVPYPVFECPAYGSFAWGFGGSGELGLGTAANWYMPKQVFGTSNMPVTGTALNNQGFSAGWYTTCYMEYTTRGNPPLPPPRIMCTGDNSFGQLGNGTTTPSQSYTPFSPPAGW